MAQSYVNPCIYCKEKIRMSDKKEGKWLPYYIEDDSPHDCKNGKKQEITLEMVQKKLEAIGIIINVERLMKQWRTSEIKNNFESKCSIKIETNSRGHNTTVHVYESVTFQKIDDTIEKAIYAQTNIQNKLVNEVVAK